MLFIKMDKEMYVKKIKNINYLYIPLQHKKFKVKHLYIFKLDAENKYIKSEQSKTGNVLITNKDVFTRGELRRNNPPVLDQKLKKITDLYLIRWQSYSTQNYWRLKYLGSTFIKD